jgi:hypothetical protein
MNAVPTSRMMEDTYTEMSKQLPPEQRAWFISNMRRVAKVETIERLAKASMIKHFTADELNALADFYSSKHLISKKPQPTEEQAHVVSHPTASM